MAELDGSGNLVAQFVYASKPHSPDYMIKYSGGLPVGTYRIVSDHLGSPRLVVDVSDGTVVQRIDYDEFGNATLVTGTWDVQPFGFAGGLWDSDTGLVRFGARDYSPEVGRWVSKDPIGFRGGSENLFAYALNDPVNFADLDGLDVDSWHGFPTMEEHLNRNQNNRCPSTRPPAGDGTADCHGRNWRVRQGKYVAADGSECVYDGNGDLIPDAGTFNFYPWEWSPQHVAWDVLPTLTYGTNYTPGLGEVYDCPCGGEQGW